MTWANIITDNRAVELTCLASVGSATLTEDFDFVEYVLSVVANATTVTTTSEISDFVASVLTTRSRVPFVTRTRAISTFSFKTATTTVAGVSGISCGDSRTALSFAVACSESIVTIDAGALLTDEIRVERHWNTRDFTSRAAVFHEVGAFANAQSVEALAVTTANFAVAHRTGSHASCRVVVSDVTDFASGTVPVSLSIVAEAAAIRFEVGRDFRDDAVAVSVAGRRTTAGDFTRSSVVSRSAQAHSSVVDVGAFTVTRTRNFSLKVDRTSQRAIRTSDVGEALAAVWRRPPAVTTASCITASAIWAVTVVAAAVTWTLEWAVEETPSGIADASAVFGCTAVARTVTAAGRFCNLVVTVTFGDAVGTVGTMVTIETTDGRFITRITHTNTFTCFVGAALTATPTSATKFGARTGFVALFAEVTLFANGAVSAVPVAGSWSETTAATITGNTFVAITVTAATVTSATFTLDLTILAGPTTIAFLTIVIW
jgi:hypothetical protein